MEERERSPHALASEAAARLGLQLTAAEVATLASDHDMGDAELGALAVTFDYLAVLSPTPSGTTGEEATGDGRRVPLPA